MAYKFSIGARKLHGALDVNSADASIDFKPDEITSDEIAELNDFDTDDLSEGASNLYYTDARSRAAFSEDTDILSYNSSTGVLSVDSLLFSGSVDDAINGHVSVDADILTYTDGVIGVNGAQYTGSVQDVVNAHLTADGDLVVLDGNGGFTTNSSAFSSSWDVKMAAADTDSLSEGASNLYFTEARSRAAISEDADILSYNSSTGVLSVDSLLFTGSAEDIVNAHLVGGTGVTVSNGNISIGQPVATSDDVTFVSGSFTGDVVVTGDLTVNGDLVTLNTSELHVEDSLIRIANGAVALAAGQGIEIGNDLASFKMDASDRWASSQDIDLASGKAFYIAGNKILDATSLHDNVKVSNANLSAVDTDDLSEGAVNLYFTEARARSVFSEDADILSYNSGTGVLSVDSLFFTGSAEDVINAHLSADGDLIVLDGNGGFTTNSSAFTASWDVKMAAADTDSLSEGASNLYFTEERVDDRVNSLLVGGDAISTVYDDGANTLTLAAQVDDSSIEIAADALQVKALGITDAMLAGSISFSKLADSANIARLDQNETVAGDWVYTGDANFDSAVTVSIAGVTMTSNQYVVQSNDYFLSSSAHADGDDIVLPYASTCEGRIIIIKNGHASNSLDVLPNVGGTIDGASSITLDSQNAAVNLISDGNNGWLVW